jgi:hypothetical protein
MDTACDRRHGHITLSDGTLSNDPFFRRAEIRVTRPNTKAQRGGMVTVCANRPKEPFAAGGSAELDEVRTIPGGRHVRTANQSVTASTDSHHGARWAVGGLSTTENDRPDRLDGHRASGRRPAGQPVAAGHRGTTSGTRREAHGANESERSRSGQPGRATRRSRAGRGATGRRVVWPDGWPVVGG